MRLKSLLWGVFSILVITSCSEKKESPAEEIKTSVEFLEEKYTIVAGAEATVSLKIAPLVKAMSAEFSVADESIVTITDKELEDDGLSIRLKSEAPRHYHYCGSGGWGVCGVQRGSSSCRGCQPDIG